MGTLNRAVLTLQCLVLDLEDNAPYIEPCSHNTPVLGPGFTRQCPETTTRGTIYPIREYGDALQSSQGDCHGTLHTLDRLFREKSDEELKNHGVVSRHQEAKFYLSDALMKSKSSDCSTTAKRQSSAFTLSFLFVHQDIHKKLSTE